MSLDRASTTGSSGGNSRRSFWAVDTLLFSLATVATIYHFRTIKASGKSIQNDDEDDIPGTLDADERICLIDESNKVINKSGAKRADMRKSNLWHRATYILVQHEPLPLKKHQDSPDFTDSRNYSDIYVLVQKRSKLKDYCPNKYDPTPGGVVGVEESFRENAEREIMEEMGIDVSEGNSQNNTLQRLFTFRFQDKRVRVWGDFYLCTFTGAMRDLVLQEEEVEEVHRWSLQELRERVDLFPGDFMPDGCHAVKLYLQRLHDMDVNRKLLDGYSSSNMDAYDLRPRPIVLFFDCDDCLYFDNWKTARRLTAKIDSWCVKHGLAKRQAHKLYKQYGTTLQGLLAEGYVENNKEAIDVYLRDVHDIPIDKLISRNDELRKMLQRIDPSIPKYIFTASVRDHAQRCLDALGIADLFVDIVDCRDCDLETKYNYHSFKAAMKKAGINRKVRADVERCMLFDDNLNNLKAARVAGWRGVLIGQTSRDLGSLVSSEHAELEVENILDLPKVLPELFVDE